MVISVKKKRFLPVIFILVMVLSGGCSVKNRYQDLDESKITVIATLFPQYDFVRQIAGEYANVILLLPPGMESHSFDPSPADMIAIDNSDIFLYTGAEMEAWAEKVIGTIDSEKVMVVDLSADIPLVRTSDIEHEHGEEEEHGEHIFEPHIWTNPVYAKIMVQNISDALKEADPEHADVYNERTDVYLAELSGLDEEIRETVSGARQKTIYFGGRFALYYFVREYGLSYEAAYDSCSSETEPSAKRVAHIADEMKEHGIKIIYYEELTDPKIAKTIAEETGSTMLLWHSCHNVSKEDFDNGVTYLELMQQNLINLKAGLE